MINDGADLEKDRLPVGQMTGDGGMGGGGGGTEWRGGQRATEPFILANGCRMLTHTIAVICLPYHLFPYSALIDDPSCLNATAVDSLAKRQGAIFLHLAINKQ